MGSRWAARSVLLPCRPGIKAAVCLGDLRSPSRAVVPVAAAIGGVALPAVIFVGINLLSPHGALDVWGMALPVLECVDFVGEASGVDEVPQDVVVEVFKS